jgi:DNA-binding protein HU-beta
VNKTELIEALVAETGQSKTDASAFLNAFEDIIVKTVKKGEKVVVTGFVSFEQVQRKARTARNPQTGEPIKVAASKAPKVSIGAAFKKAIKG